MTIEQKKLFSNVVSFIRYQTLQDSFNIQRMFCDESTKQNTKNAVQMMSWLTIPRVRQRPINVWNSVVTKEQWICSPYLMLLTGIAQLTSCSTNGKFDSRQGKEIFLRSTMSKACSYTHPASHTKVIGGSSPKGVKRPGREAQHSPL
jgi:hypothetical protein